MSRGLWMSRTRTLTAVGLTLVTLSLIPLLLSKEMQSTSPREDKAVLLSNTVSSQVLRAIHTLTSMPEESLRDLPVEQLTSLKKVVRLHLASLLKINDKHNNNTAHHSKEFRDASMLARFTEMSRSRLVEHIHLVMPSTDSWTRMKPRDAPVPVSTGDMAAFGGERSLRQMRCLVQLVSAHGACPMSGREEDLGVTFASRLAPAVAIKQHLLRCVDTLFRHPRFVNRSLSRAANAVDDLCDLYAVSGLDVSQVRRRKAIPLAARQSAAHQTLSTPSIGGCFVRMLDTGIPAAFFEQSTDRVASSSGRVSENMTIGGVALRNDGSRSFERRLPWKPFDIAPLSSSWLWDSTTRPSVRSELGLREALNVMERSYYVFMDVWEGDLGKQQAALHRGQQFKDWVIEERFEEHQSNKRHLAKHSGPVAAAIERLKSDYVIEGAYSAEASAVLVRPRGTDRNRILQAPVQEEPLLTLAEAVTIAFLKMNKTGHHRQGKGNAAAAAASSSSVQQLPSFLWKSDAQRSFLPLDLRIPLVIAAGAVPLFRDFKQRSRMFLHPLCDNCYPSMPHDAYGRVYKASGLSFATPHGRPVVDWMRFDAERYAILRSDLIKHARSHMTTRAMALNVLRRTKPEARSVVVLADNPRLVALHALVHGLCDLGHMQVWLPRALEDGMRGDPTSRAVFGLLSGSPYRACIRFANHTAGIEVASSEAQVVVAILDDRPVSPMLNRVDALRQNLQQAVSGDKRTPRADTAVLYTGGHSNHLGFLKAICRWSNRARGTAVIFHTRRVGPAKTPATGELHVNVGNGDRTYAISGEGELPLQNDQAPSLAIAAPRYACEKRSASNWFLLNKKRADAPRLYSQAHDEALFPMQFDPSCLVNNIWSISAEVSRVASAMIGALQQRQEPPPPLPKSASVASSGRREVNRGDVPPSTTQLPPSTTQVPPSTRATKADRERPIQPRKNAAASTTAPLSLLPLTRRSTPSQAPTASAAPPTHTTPLVAATTASPRRAAPESVAVSGGSSNERTDTASSNPFDPFIIPGPLSLRARVLSDIREATGCRVRWSTVPGDEHHREVTVRIVGCNELPRALEAKNVFLKHVKKQLPPR